jgi:DNA gyrase subunit A
MVTKILPREISEELRQSYLDYSMSVIVSRALPDARDGLKPVQRRILYVMKELGLWSNEKFTKCANVVGTTLARYHPHGDQAVYDALVRMAQPFSLRYPLVWGQGNFGSIDGDPPAQMRYTEAKLTKIAEEMLADIDKETVDFRPNYDNTREEPVVLPSGIPNLLLNGSLGIAVGMATNIPPHNLKEVLNAAKYLIENENASIKDLLQFIKGPDFPTGGIILVKEKDLEEIYTTGRGGLIIRGETKVEISKRGSKRLVITSVPFQVNKADLVKEIAKLILEKELDEVKDVRDESSKEGVRVVLELKPNAEPKDVLYKLYRFTDLQKTFYFNLIALEDGIQPKLFNLKDLLLSWLNHRREVVKRRTIFDLNKNKERVHLLEGFDIALANLDKLIKIIRQSKDKNEAIKKMTNVFDLTIKQAEAILELPLRTLTRLERDKILSELKERKKIIEELESILRSKKKMDQVLIKEFDELIKKYGDERLTKVYERKEEEKVEKPQGTYFVLINDKHKIFFYSPDQAAKVKEKLGQNRELVGSVFFSDANENLYLFSKNGRAFSVPLWIYIKKPKYLESVISLEKNDQIVSFFLTPAKEIVILTKLGFIKRMKIEEVISSRKKGVRMINLKKGDEVIKVLPLVSEDNLLLVTANGQAISFKPDIPLQTKTASGVKGIKLRPGDFVNSATFLTKKELIFIFRDGYIKKILSSEIKLQKRGGLGIKVFESNYGGLIDVFSLGPEDELLILDDKIKRVKIKNIPLMKRYQKPKKLENIGKISNVYVI